MTLTEKLPCFKLSSIDFASVSLTTFAGLPSSFFYSAVNSANKYLTITSIVSDGAIATDIQAGILGTGALTGTVFAGRTRIRGLTGTSKASAGNIVFKNTSITGTSLLTIPLTGAVSSIDPYVPDNGVLFKAGAYVNLTAAEVTGITEYYDG